MVLYIGLMENILMSSTKGKLTRLAFKYWLRPILLSYLLTMGDGEI